MKTKLMALLESFENKKIKIIVHRCITLEVPESDWPILEVEIKKKDHRVFISWDQFANGDEIIFSLAASEKSFVKQKKIEVSQKEVIIQGSSIHYLSKISQHLVENIEIGLTFDLEKGEFTLACAEIHNGKIVLGSDEIILSGKSKLKKAIKQINKP